MNTDRENKLHKYYRLYRRHMDAALSPYRRDIQQKRSLHKAKNALMVYLRIKEKSS